MKNYQAEVYRTCKESGERLASCGTLSFRAPNEQELKGKNEWALFIHDSITFQELEGIGGALTEATCWTLAQMPESMRSDVLDSYFAPPGGCGCDIVRVAMNSCDFSLENYSCDDVAGDRTLAHFSIDRDRKWVVPVLQQALRRKPGLKVLISPWSPPAWMKSNNDMNHGGKLLAEYAPAWAEFFCRYIEELGKEGIPVWALTVNNEPNARQKWDSLEMSAVEERDFVRDHLGPALTRHGLEHVKIMIWDHNRDHLLERASVVFADPEAARYVWGTAFHWYGDNCYENVAVTHDAFPDKKLFFSEGCNGGNNYSDPEWLHFDQPDPNGVYIHRGIWEAGERYAHNMITDFNHFTCGWLDWNMVLNEKGGPRHLPNGCGAPYIYDTGTGKLETLDSFWYLAHFTRFLSAGDRRMASSTSQNALESVVFRKPDGTVVAITLNRSERKLSFQVKFDGQFAAVELPPRSIETFVIRPGR